MSCRLGSIMKEGLHSDKLQVLMLRNNLIEVIQGTPYFMQGLEKFPNLLELELYDNKIIKIEGLEALTNL